LFQDYQDLKVPLSDIPVNPATCSELVRLCLRRQDVRDDESDDSEGGVEDDQEVVRLSQLGSNYSQTWVNGHLY